MKVIVLGGCGFLGSHVAEQLLQRGHDVSIFARPNADRRNLRAVENRLHFISGDFLNVEDVRRAIAGKDAVIHLVGSTLPGHSLVNPAFDIQTHVVASTNLFSACVEAGVSRIIYASSGGTVYGIPKSLSIDESHPLDPIIPYGLTKLSVEKLLGIYAYQYCLGHAILRLSNPYGSRQRPDTGQGVISTWMYHVRQGNPIEIWGDGSIVRDYIAVGDAASAIAMATESSSFNGVLNVGSGRGHSLNELIPMIEHAASRKLSVVYRQTRKSDVPRNVLNIAKIEAQLDWKACTQLEDGIRAMWKDLSA